MNKIISFCLWGDDPKYCVGAVRNAELAQDIYPDWTCRFYLGACVPQDIVAQLIQYDNVEIILSNQPGNWKAMFWRFEPAYEESVDIMISRDTDSRLNLREKAAVDEWLVSDKDFHIMRDHPWHGTPILGGLWGIKNGAVPNFRELLEARTKEDQYDTDQAFLREEIYPIIANNVMIHADFHRYESHAKVFPTPRKDLEFVGEVFDEHDQNTPLHTNAIEVRLNELIKVSVCVPCHTKQVKRLLPLIRSLETQTEKIDEVVIVLNPAPFSDEVTKAIKDITTSLNVKYIFSEEASSGSAARNECAIHATGNILSFIDADDISSPFRNGCVKRFFVRNPDADCLVHNYYTGNEDITFKLSGFDQFEECTLREENGTKLGGGPSLKVSGYKPIHHGHLSIRKEIFNLHSYDQKIGVGDDSHFLREVIRAGNKVHYTEEKLTHYTTNFSFYK